MKEPRIEILPGWKSYRVNNPPFRQIAVIAPNGYVATVDSMSRNPENIMYMLLDQLLIKQEVNRAEETKT